MPAALLWALTEYMGNLLESYRSLDRADDAIALRRKAVDAIAALARASPDSFDPRLATRLLAHEPAAAIELGMQLALRGDAVRARTLLEAAIDGSDREEAASAMLSLGLLLAIHGEVADAMATFQQGVAGARPDEYPPAAIDIGDVLAKRGDVRDALTAYQIAIDSRHPEYFPRAAMLLAGLHVRQGDLEAAGPAYQLAIGSDHAEVSPKAALNLGVLLDHRGDLDGARRAYQYVIDSHDADAARTAWLGLGFVLRKQGGPRWCQGRLRARGRQPRSRACAQGSIQSRGPLSRTGRPSRRPAGLPSCPGQWASGLGVEGGEQPRGYTRGVTTGLRGRCQPTGAAGGQVCLTPFDTALPAFRSWRTLAPTTRCVVASDPVIQ